MASVRELLDANLLQVFGNRDGEARRRAVDSVYAPDVRFTDPDGTVTGRGELERRAAELLERTPADFVFTPDGPAYADATTGALAWTLGPAGGEPVARGIDIITVADGAVTALHTILDGTPGD